MNRRTFLAGLAASPTPLVAGCFGSRDVGTDSAGDTGNNTGETDSTDDPLAGTAESPSHVALRYHGLEEVTDSSVTILLEVAPLLAERGQLGERGTETVVCAESDIRVCANVDFEISAHVSYRDGERFTWGPFDKCVVRTSSSGQRGLESPDREKPDLPTPGIIRPDVDFDLSKDETIASTRANTETGPLHELTFTHRNDLPARRPFCLAFTFDTPQLDGSSARDSSEVIASSQQIVRASDDSYLYPELSAPRLVDNRDAGYTLTDRLKYTKQDFSSYDLGELADQQIDGIDRTRIDEDPERATLFPTGSGATIRQTRVTPYGRYSPDLGEFVASRPDDGIYQSYQEELSSGHGTPRMLPVVRPNVWTVDYDISKDEYETHRAIAATRRHETDSDEALLRTLATDEVVMDSAAVGRVGDKLQEVCVHIGVTHPVEQARLLADFIQYLEYVPSGLAFGGRPVTPDTPSRLVAPEQVTVRDGLVHTPTETLANACGSCAERSLLAKALFDHFGIDSVIALYEFSGQQSFDVHAVILVDTETLEISDWVEDAARPIPWQETYEPFHIVDGTRYGHLELTSPMFLGETTEALRAYSETRYVQ